MNQSIELDHFIYFVLDLNPVLLVDIIWCPDRHLQWQQLVDSCSRECLCRTCSQSRYQCSICYCWKVFDHFYRRPTCSVASIPTHLHSPRARSKSGHGNVPNGKSRCSQLCLLKRKRKNTRVQQKKKKTGLNKTYNQHRVCCVRHRPRQNRAPLSRLR